MDKFSPRLKVYTRKNTHSALEEESMFCVSGFADLCLFSTRGIVPRDCHGGGIPG